MSVNDLHYLHITEIDYEADQFLTLGRAQFASETECADAYHTVPEVQEDRSARREYKLDRYENLARVDEKFIAADTVIKILGADLTHLHDQAAAALDHEVNTYLTSGPVDQEAS